MTTQNKQARKPFKKPGDKMEQYVMKDGERQKINVTLAGTMEDPEEHELPEVEPAK